MRIETTLVCASSCILALAISCNNPLLEQAKSAVEVALQPRMAIAIDSSSLSAGGTKDLGNVQIGKTKTFTFTINNSGKSNLTLLGGTEAVSLSGTDQTLFSVTQPELTTLPAGGSTTFGLSFSSLAEGLRTVNVTIASNDPKAASFTFVVTATGVYYYYVTYYDGGSTEGTIPSDVAKYMDGDTVKVLGNTGGLAKTHCVFMGWNTAYDGSGTAYSADDTFSISGDVDLYAQWDAAIYVVAGTGSEGYSGDGGLATAAMLDCPEGIAVDAAGNLYISDTRNYRVRKVLASDGTISTVAGTGVSGYSGDGGPATSATFKWPSGLAVDTDGNLYIADIDSHCIRKVATDGTISTFAGTGVSGYSGDDGAAASAQLWNPSDVAIFRTTVPSNLFYIADSANHCIRKVDASGIITTFAGTPGTYGYSGDGGSPTAATLYYPHAVVADLNDTLHIADTFNNRIRMVWYSGTPISTQAGTGVAGYSGDGGLATDAQLKAPIGITVDNSYNVYIADYDNSCIRKLTVGSSTTITTLVGTGSAGWSSEGTAATQASIAHPNDLAWFDPDLNTYGDEVLYIVDTYNSRILKIYNP
jgi:sugar lactone lactonase YvrE